MKKIALIPARAGSKRLKNKNLLEIRNNTTLIEHTILKVKRLNCFDEIWVNSDSEKIKKIAMRHKVNFFKRDKSLANDKATSEDYISDFLKKVKTDYVFQIHSIAPLLTEDEICKFVKYFEKVECSTLLSFSEDSMEHSIDGIPINFSFDYKQNSQDIKPIERINWAITGWNAKVFLKNRDQDRLATYSPPVQFFKISKTSGIVIKDNIDFHIARHLICNSEKFN